MQAVEVPDPRFVGEWGDEPSLVPYGPDPIGWDTVEDAIAWARRRAPIVRLRRVRTTYRWRYHRFGDRVVRLVAPPAHEVAEYAAGKLDDADARYVRWPGSSDARDDDLVAAYGGVAYLVEQKEGFGADVGVAATWEVLQGGAMRLRESIFLSGDGRVGEAAAWARERAEYVLVRLGEEEVNGYFSGGDRDIPGLDLPRWPVDLSVHPPPGARPGDTWTSWAPPDVFGRTFPID